MNIHLLFSGPIRPNIDCVKFVVNNYKSQLKEYNIITYLSTWNNYVDTHKNLSEIFDHVVINDSPTDEYIYKNLTNKTIQQIQLHNTDNEIDNWTISIYKMFTGLKYLIDYINDNNLINDNDIAIRIRLDCIFYINDWNKIFNSIKEDANRNINNYYVNFVKGTANYSDWFGLSTYKNIKTIWYYKDINYLNLLVKNSFCAEMMVKNNANINKINSINIKNILNEVPLNYLVRKYIDDNNYKKHFYE